MVPGQWDAFEEGVGPRDSSVVGDTVILRRVLLPSYVEATWTGMHIARDGLLAFRLQQALGETPLDLRCLLKCESGQAQAPSV